MVWEGRDAVKTGRGRFRKKSIRTPWMLTKANCILAILGATNPLASAPGTIRGDFALVGAFRNPGEEKDCKG